MPTQTARQTMTVTGWIDMYKDEKGFGFIEVIGAIDPDTGRGIRAFFHVTKAYKVIVQNDGSPTITGVRHRDAMPRATRPNATFVVAEIRKSDKGWTAIRWGFRPGPNWVYSFMDANIDPFKPYIGGTVTYHNIGEPGGLERGILLEANYTPVDLTIIFDRNGRRVQDTLSLFSSKHGQPTSHSMLIRLPSSGYELVFTRPADVRRT